MRIQITGIDARRPIAAIKAVRSITGWDLAAAKRLIDNFRTQSDRCSGAFSVTVNPHDSTALPWGAVLDDAGVQWHIVPASEQEAALRLALRAAAAGIDGDALASLAGALPDGVRDLFRDAAAELREATR